MNRLVFLKLAITILLFNTAVSVTMGAEGKWTKGLYVKRPLQNGPQREITKGVLIVADPRLVDPNFSKTVVLVTHDGPGGTIGVIINRPTTTPLSRLLPDIKELKDRPDTLYIGGPVFYEVLVVLLRTQVHLESTDQVFDDVYFGHDMKTLTGMLKENSPKSAFRVYAGYAGWAPGQLQAEFDRGDWRIIRADSGAVFEQDTETVWPEMIGRSSEQLIKDLSKPSRPRYAQTP
jgi:putative transcriptional regulator